MAAPETLNGLNGTQNGVGNETSNSTNAAILSMMQSEACALGKYGIRCNALLPGTTRTQFAAEDLTNAEKLKYVETRTPLGRVGDPDDLAGPAIFLASDLSKYVTGAQLLVDGGLSISLQ
jgi:L-rhamnose 1-dehydrogenase